jgi:hypothetical protein
MGKKGRKKKRGGRKTVPVMLSTRADHMELLLGRSVQREFSRGAKASVSSVFQRCWYGY